MKKKFNKQLIIKINKLVENVIPIQEVGSELDINRQTLFN